MFQEHQQVVLGNFGVTWVEFDNQEDLLWSGTTNGYIKSFYGVGLDRYTSFCRHSEGVCQTTPLDGVVLSLSPSQLHCSMKTGMPLYTLREREELADMQCMRILEQTSSSSTMAVGMLSGSMATVDIATSSITRNNKTVESGVVGLKWNGSAIVCSDAMGKVHLVDPSTLQVQSSVLAHHGSVTDLEVCGNYIITCGCRTRKYKQRVTDSQLMVFDQRTLKALPPLPTLDVEPHFLRGLPVDPSHILVASQMGMFQFLNISGLLTPNSMMVHQLPPFDQTTPPCVFSVAISPSGHFIVFGDGYGALHSWVSMSVGMDDAEGMFLNPYAQPSVFPDPPEPLPHIDFDDPMQGIPLSALPVYRFSENGLASDYWPKQWARFTRRRLAPIPPQILGQMKVQEFVGYAPKPSHLKRNQIPYVQHHSEARKDFLMEPESPMMRASPFFGVPKSYRKTQIKYTKWGVEEFDFRHYNSTDFAGLEIHIPNAYCNCMIQVFFFLEPLRSALWQHICEKEFCLSCELNFLFGMMRSTSGETCQASNFLRAFRTLREALTLGLLLNEEEEEDKADLSKLIQKWNTFVLQQLHMEMQSHMPKAPPPDSTPPKFSSAVEELFQSRVEKVTVCRCEAEEVQEITEMVFPLHYPSTTLQEGKPLPYPFGTSTEDKLGEAHSPAAEERVPFSSVIQSSVCSEQVTQAWCTKCDAFKRVVQRRQLLSLPKVLSLNCQVEKTADKEFWRRQQKLSQANCRKPWVPAELQLSLSSDKVLQIHEVQGSAKREPQQTEECESCLYELRAVVCHVRSTEGPGNLVAHILTAPCHSKGEEGGERSERRWYLFNDFVIQPLSKVQATQFEVDWLTPCILLYAQTDLESSYENKGQLQFDPSVLLVRTTRPTVIPLSPLHFTPLHFHDLPKAGDLAAIDAEFVTLNQEEAEVRTDGTQTTIKPSQLSVARISCVRGWGNLEGTPFIDDYIRTQEQVVDYLTQFSGIKPGDLDDTVSSKHLTTLKTSYLKLLYMIQTGLVFIGHGLKKDFRVINIKVPGCQILDTAELFRLPDQRYFSLKFLSWYILGKRVQEGCHDSIEDARTALFLYRRYEELKNSGQLQDTLVNLYEAGREMQWKVPARN